jgi:hypothetical protein
LNNWMIADREGKLGGLVRLNISEMKCIMQFCSAGSAKPVNLSAKRGEEVEFDPHMLMKLKKKVTKCLNISGTHASG